MKFNTKTRYGLRAMIEIAKTENGKGVFQKDIAKNQGISVKYLDQIIAALKAADLIKNTGGKKSGYVVARAANTITVYDIYKAFESELKIADVVSTNPNDPELKRDITVVYWTEINKKIINLLENTNLGTLVKKQIQFDSQLAELNFII